MEEAPQPKSNERGVELRAAPTTADTPPLNSIPEYIKKCRALASVVVAERLLRLLPHHLALVLNLVR